MRQLAKAALQAYGLGDARLTFLRQAGNTLFRVSTLAAAPNQDSSSLFAESQYLLRIHQPEYQTTDAIDLELAWLTAMRRDADLPVPEPVPTLDGKRLTRVSIPGVPGARNCSLLRWLKGRYLTKGIRPDHYRAQGQLMARLHNHAAGWQQPPRLTKRHWDKQALFEDVEGTSLTSAEIWPLIPPQYVEPFEVVIGRVGQVMDRWGTGPDVYGLIHGDLGIDANVLFWHGKARAIDFDDSGFGYWIYDLAISLEHCREDEAFPLFREALLDGYSALRPLPQEQLAHLGLFMSAFDVYLCLWAAAGAHLFPSYRDEALQRFERAAGFVVRYVEGSQVQVAGWSAM